MKVGIAITAYHRYELSKYCLEQWKKYSPNDFVIIVVGDVDGIAKAKNICLKRLEELGVTDFFLADEDCYPIAYNWWKPYVKSSEPHLLYQFKLPGKPKSDMKELYRDDKIVAYTHTRGAMIYIKKVVLEVVGGLDEEYGEYGYEHPDWTNRIFNAGLTTHRAMDVPNSKDLLYCLDQDSEIESSVSADIRKASLLKNYGKYKRSRLSREYKEYK